ncbi:MAG: hypothetical protein NW241_05865 [Bacteroidia bacterium]|nr:hypothetical protein [Bacteroidia bacterium]
MIALLTDDALLRNWFRNQHPDVYLSSSADETVLGAAGLILAPAYEVHGQHYQALDLWQWHCARTAPQTKLMLWSYASAEAANCLTLERAAGSSPVQWLDEFLPAQAYPAYPRLFDLNLRDLALANLSTHGQHNLQDLLYKLSEALYAGPAAQDACWRQLGRFWDTSEPAFRLMPFYLKIRQHFIRLEAADRSSPAQVREYIRMLLREATALTEFYKLEPVPCVATS